MTNRTLVISFLSLTFLFGIISCSENSSEPDHLMELIPTDTTDSAVVIVPVKKEVKAKPKLPFLLIQNCGALWPLSCSIDSVVDQKNFKEMVNSYFNEEPLVSIGPKGVQNQVLENSYCMRGECGGNQMAFELSNKECFGILGSKKVLDSLNKFHFITKCKIEDVKSDTVLQLLQIDSFKLAVIKELDSLYWYPNKEVQISLYADENKKYIEQSYSIEFEDTSEVDEDNPYSNENVYNLSFRRVLVKHKDKWIVGKWKKNVADVYDNPIENLLVSYSGSRVKIISYEAEGICCPSESKLYYFEYSTKADSLKLRNSFTHKAGLGQPCD